MKQSIRELRLVVMEPNEHTRAEKLDAWIKKSVHIVNIQHIQDTYDATNPLKEDQIMFHIEHMMRDSVSKYIVEKFEIDREARKKPFPQVVATLSVYLLGNLKDEV